MTAWIADDDGRQICPDCAIDECSAGPPCDRLGCHCGLCGMRRERAVSRDERLPTLAELRTEQHGRLGDLTAERWGAL